MSSTNDVEPVAIKCNGCETWSSYDKKYNNKMPKGWRETDKGYFCNNCRKGE